MRSVSWGRLAVFQIPKGTRKSPARTVNASDGRKPAQAWFRSKEVDTEGADLDREAELLPHLPGGQEARQEVLDIPVGDRRSRPGL